jgi:pimeloyl-ACP methyl ester carboxylesterase
MLAYSTYQHPHSSEWVTFVHGAGGSSSIWFKQVREFRKHFNVLLVDLRGHGKSIRQVNQEIKSYTFQMISDEVVQVLRHLEIKQSHFVGISLGTILIREIADRYPSLVKSMILGGAVMKINLKGRLLVSFGRRLQSVLPYMILYKIFAFVIMPRGNHKEARNLFIREAKKLYQKEFNRWFAMMGQLNPLLSLFRIKELNIPTLYIMGEQDHMFLPSVQKLLKTHLSSQLSVISDCGHVVNVEQPVLFNQNAIEFIKQN